MIPAFSREIVWSNRGATGTERTKQTKDSVAFSFRNGSVLENVAASEHTRGRRFHSGLVEESIGVDENILNEVIIPTLNVERRVNGEVDPNEWTNQSQIFITTAGYKSTFSYQKLIQLLCQSVAQPDKAIILGGSWRVPVKEGLLARNFLEDIKNDGTYNEDAFQREYESAWAGAVEGAFFDADQFDKARVVQLAADKPKPTVATRGFYVLGVDVGRVGCTTEVALLECTKKPDGKFQKKLVNIFTFDCEHFGLQSIKIKQIFLKYKCQAAVIDANGLGAGLIDFMVTDQTDPDTGDDLPSFGVINDDEGKFKRFENEGTMRNAIYMMKANININTECYAYTQSQIRNGNLQFLIDEPKAKAKLKSQKQFAKMTPSQRADYIYPYTQTSILREQMMNLIREDSGEQIRLKQSSTMVKKDKFSALIYGLYYCKMIEDRGANKKIDPNKMMLFTTAKKRF